MLAVTLSWTLSGVVYADVFTTKEIILKFKVCGSMAGERW